MAGIGVPENIGAVFDALETGDDVFPLIQRLSAMYMGQAAFTIFSSGFISTAVQRICTSLQMLCCETVLHQDLGSFRSAGGTTQQVMQVISSGRYVRQLTYV